MQIDRPNMIFRNGMLAEQQRVRVSAVPLRYKCTWKVSRVVELEDDQVGLYDTHCVVTDDAGRRVTYTCLDDLGVGMTKRQAIRLLGDVPCTLTPAIQKGSSE